MEKTHNVTTEQAVTLVMGWLDGIEVKGHANVVAMAKAMDLLAKVKEFVHEDPKPAEEPVVELVPVEDPDQVPENK